ncbi:hypothetical protein [Saccharothrix algeriensis]|uniref:hypothetical protein n=1 Tax=Saccharothrix algeriensis TaxID=173560 RepID=UPI001958CB8D|nr:hypothetical protein [Saccharothrix algeriensis]
MGRAAELSRLRRSLAEDRSDLLIVLEGQAGAGKSALAVRAARDAARHFPGGLVYVDLRHTTPVVASPPAGKGQLWVLDNATSAEQVEQRLPFLGGNAALVTSTGPLGLPGDVRTVHVGPLSEEDSVALLAELAGENRVRAESEQVRRLVELCDRLPLALRIAAARLAARPAWRVGALVDLLADERRCLDELRADALNVRTSLAASYDALRDDGGEEADGAMQAFHRLGALESAGLDRHAAADLLGMTPERAERVLERLVDSRLVESQEPGSYRVPNLVRLFARERASDSEHAERHRGGRGRPGAVRVS